MNELFSEKLVTSRRTYYFDVKETKEGSKYLVIGELTQMGAEMERHRVMVFEESLNLFMDGLDKAVDFILNNGGGGQANEPRGDAQDGLAGDVMEEMHVLRRIEGKLDRIGRHFK
ncbi:MAG TPA: DUF3276 family protein [Blastocatellia bacterium]|nr:DUF3276 family protein [Blastocatellia bacterium]